MWATRDVLLMTVAVATLTIVVTILANRKLNDMIDAKASQRSAMSGNMSPMLSVLGNMKHAPVSREPHDAPEPAEMSNNSAPSGAGELETETEPSTPVDHRPPTVYSSPDDRPQGAGGRWTPI